MSINYKNPIHQRKLMAAMANPVSNKLGIQESITAQTATDQTAWKGMLTNMGIQDEAHKASMEHAYAKLDFQKSQFNEGMSNAKSASKLAMYGGLGTALIAGMFGRQMRNDKEREYLARKKIYDRLDNLYGVGGVI